MARLAVFASGNGSNFQAIAEALRPTPHRLVCLVCDRRGAFAVERAAKLEIPVVPVRYKARTREDAERELLDLLAPHRPDLIALAGYMKLLTALFLNSYKDRVINIHPALLPKYPGTDGIGESYASTDRELGITIHRVDDGVDTGPILVQHSFVRSGVESLEEIESRIHALEHRHYPATVLRLLDEIDAAGGPSAGQEAT